MHDFIKRRFLEFSLTQQHKKCAEILYTLFSDPSSNTFEIYNQIATWMNLEPLENLSKEMISNRYHFHLKSAHITKKEHHLLPSIKKGDKEQACEAYPISIYLDNLRSAHNVGSIIRTVEAFRLGTILFSEKTPFIDHDQVKKTSMGSFEWVNCHKLNNFDSLPHPIIALETSENAISLYDFIFPEVFTLIVGNEEYGCSEHTLQIADYVLEIPLRGRKNSLNVANAFAIVASEIIRQKGKK